MFSSRDKRQWLCFVCGLAHENYDEFKAHIFKKHEEGRDYVLCPLTRCGAPVRDIKAHFAAKHPHEKLPPVKMYRALIWRDAKKKKTRKPKFKEGNFQSAKMNGKVLHFRSGMELDAYRCLEEDPRVAAYSGEPFSIKYLFEGEVHEYFPDILVHFKDGHSEIWEIKPANQTSLPKNRAKWKYAEDYCIKRGWGWRVVKEQDINKLRREIRANKL